MAEGGETVRKRTAPPNSRGATVVPFAKYAIIAVENGCKPGAGGRAGGRAAAAEATRHEHVRVSQTRHVHTCA